MKRLQVLILNFDGTLADTAQAWRQAFNLSFADHGLACWFDDKISSRRFFRSARESEWIKRLGKHHDLDVKTAESVLSRRDEHFAGMVEKRLIPMRADAKALLASAQSSGVDLAVATMASRGIVEAVLDNTYGETAQDMFRLIQCREDVAPGKPDAGFYGHVATSLGLSPLDCLAIESSAQGVRSAYDAGLYTIGLRNNQNSFEHLEPVDIRLDRLDLPSGQLLALAGGPKAPPLITELAALL